MQLTMDDLTRLLAPIDEAAPCGSYLKAERALFRPLRNQFNIAQTSFRKLSQNPDPAELDDLLLENATAWEQLADQLVEVTTGQSKDLELMSWLAMSQLFHGDPLAGRRRVGPAWRQSARPPGSSRCHDTTARTGD